MDAKPRILGVDDSLTIRKALEIVLKPAGYDLDLAADGAEAIHKAKTIKPALILLDFILPDMHGTDVCRQLAVDPDTADIPVVLISAKGAEIRQAYRDIGNVVSYIAKPFKPQSVTRVVADVLAKSAAGELIKLTEPLHEGESILPAPPAASPQPPSVTATLTPEFMRAEAPTNGDGAHYEVELSAHGNGREDADEDGEASLESATTDVGPSAAVRREMLDWMFEALRAGLEGVYVEEVDTPAGAAADQAKTYTDLIEQLSRQLEESLRHARSGTRYTLYGDGSVRSLDETLLDVFRRSCRLLFRAAVAGAVGNEVAANRQRILVACHHDGAVHEQIRSLLSAHADWQVLIVSEGFRQLPMMTRLYGPTHVIAELTWKGGLWDQLRVLQRMPEARDMTVIGIVDSARLAELHEPDTAGHAAALAERGVTRVLSSAFDFERDMDAASAPPDATPTDIAPVFSNAQAAM